MLQDLIWRLNWLIAVQGTPQEEAARLAVLAELTEVMIP